MRTTSQVWGQQAKYENNLSSGFFAAAMANLRPQNLPFSAIHRKFYYFFMKNLFFLNIFIIQVVFKSEKFLKTRIVPSLHFLITVLKLHCLLSVSPGGRLTLLSIPLVVIVIFNLFLMPFFFSLVLDSYLVMFKFLGLGPSPSIILYF